MSSNQTVTSDTASTSTFTPVSVIISKEKTESFAFTRWTLSTTTTTTSLTTVPSCFVSSRQSSANYSIRFKPRRLPFPQGLVLQPRDIGGRWAASISHKRSSYAPTTTITTPVRNGQTSTSTLQPTTTTETVRTTITSFTTPPPSTVFANGIRTVRCFCTFETKSIDDEFRSLHPRQLLPSSALHVRLIPDVSTRRADRMHLPTTTQRASHVVLL